MVPHSIMDSTSAMRHKASSSRFRIGSYRGPMAVAVGAGKNNLAKGIFLAIALAAAAAYGVPKINLKPIAEPVIEILEHKRLDYVAVDLEALVRAEASSILSDSTRTYDYSELFSKTSAFEDYILEGACIHNVDYNLCLAFIAQESSGDMKAESKKGAKGLAQLKWSAAKEKGVTITRFEDYRYHPASTSEGIGYFEDQLERFHNPIIALMAYNRGCTKVRSSLQNTWLDKGYSLTDLAKVSMENFPEDIWKAQSDDAREHVKIVYALKYLLDHGFKYEKRPLWSDRLKNATPIQLAEGEGIYSIAKEYGVSVEAITELNPQLRNIDNVGAGQTIYLPN